jgi:hypothetical protein
MNILIIRKKVSFDYKYDPRLNTRGNNTKNVYKDTIRLQSDDGVTLFTAPCQSVSIHPDVTERESIAPGVFKVRLFADRRVYQNPVHEIINACDLEGERIDETAMQDDAEQGRAGRWLIHDDMNKATGRPYTAPWSAGCIMLRATAFEQFNETLKLHGAKPGTIITAELAEI